MTDGPTQDRDTSNDSSGDDMRAFWNERAQEDAYFFVDNRRAYRDPALERFWMVGERDLDRILGMFDVVVQPSQTVLDIGCGVGRLTRPLAERAGHVYGIDISAEMLGLARRHHADLDNVEWLLGDGSTLQPIPDMSVDVCVSHVVFQHIPDPRVTMNYVREMGRVLSPGGSAVFQVSNAPVAHAARQGTRAQVRRLAAALGRAPGGQRDRAWLGSAVDLEQLRQAGRTTGLEVERIVGEGTQFCMVLARRGP
jgi:ubiquinone/menaquinone biosynthesis C-methylase UbiE